MKTQAVIACSVIGVWHSVQGQIGGRSNFPTSGLVLFAKFSEGSGNTVADSSGNGHTGYLMNSPAWIPGVTGTNYALNFVAANQQSASFGNLNLAGSNQCTLSMWMQKTNPADIGLAALGCTSGTYNAIFLAWWDDGNVYGGVGFTNAGIVFEAPYVANTWVHFVMVYDGTQLENSNRINIFINGVPATPSPDQSWAQTPISTSIGTVSTNFSLAWDSNEGYESGRYDGVGVWNRVLSATEIQQVYSNAAAGPPSPILSFDLRNNASVSNAAFTVTGTATGGTTVTNVFYQLDGTGWNTAQTTNGWINWEANVILIPGTNVIQAYAVDSLGNISATNQVSFDCVLSTVLTVTTNGNGTVNPNYNGALLQIGKSYSITATPGTGFAFTSWTGGANRPLTVLTNGTTVTFLMVSNLMLQANFVDVTKPTSSITNVTAGMNVSNASFTVKGTAGDNVAVSNVFYSLNNTGWSIAVTGNNWSNWTAVVTLTPGTNIIQAFAVDTSGNISATNTLNFVYVASATLTVSTNGLGSLNPNYNGASLQIGKGYSITASPATGFKFTNWTGGTSLPLAVRTNGTTVQFLMASNLMLQASFIDIAKPTLSITNLTAGQRVSNAVYTAKGKASDNWQVSNVWYQLVGSGWNQATNINHWTNWSAENLQLTPGTNTFLAYAVDTTGNRSTTNSVSFQYVVSAPLQVQLTGKGTLSPNYSNAALAIGTNYTMTATPGTGFRFTNWTGGTTLPLALLTNGTTLQFRMQSNLVLQANFIDIAKPSLSITNLTSGQRVSNALFTVRGTASDNWQVSNVRCQLNSTGWSNAFTGNVWTNWASAEMTLIPGTNVVSADAMDTSSNVSTTSSVSFQYVVTNQLGVRAVGLGTLNPNYSNAWLEIGRNYSMTATPGNGFMFTNWTLSTNWIGGVKTNNTTVRFMMKSNLTLQVGFVDVTRPTLTITAPTGGQRMTNALANVRGTASDNWRVTNVWYQLNTNAWSLATSTNGWTNWTVTLTLVTGTNTVRAYAVDLGSKLSLTNSVSFVSSNTFKLQLGFGAGPSLDGNGLGFDLQISLGLNGRIEASTNLMDWVTLTNYIGTNATLHFRDVAATNLNHRFYRAVTP